MDLVVSFLDFEFGDLVLQELSLQFLTVHSELVLRDCQLVEELFHSPLLVVVLVNEFGVFRDKLLIFTTLVRIEFIEPEFHLFVDALQFVLEVLSLLFYPFPLHEDIIEFILEFIIVVLNMLIGIFHIFRASIGSKFI